MTPKQYEAIKRHGERLLAIFPEAIERDPVQLCLRLRRLEVRAHAYTTRLCNEQVPEPEQERVEQDIDTKLCHLLSAGRVWLNRDPRGYALKMDLLPGEALHTDMGGYGILAPEIDRKGE